MKRFALLALLFIPAMVWAGPKESSVQIAYSQFSQDEKQVKHLDTKYGSGTVVEYKGGFSYILTCRHVVEDDDGYITVFAGDLSIQAHFVAADGTADLALIRAKVKLPTVGVADRPPDPLTNVDQYGYPGAGPLEHKVGQINGSTDKDSTGYVPNQALMFCHPGDSGSGVFAGDKLVGVLYAGKKTSDGRGLYPSLSVKLADVQRFLKDPTANPPKAEPELPKIPPAAPACPPGKP